MAASAYYHYHNSDNKKKINNTTCQAATSIQQWFDEQLLFDSFGRNYATLFVHMPICSTKYQHQKKKNSNKHHYFMDNRLKSTSKTPLDIGTLDDILFISTLQNYCCTSTRLSLLSSTTKRPMTQTTVPETISTVEMKRGHSAHHFYSQQEEEEQVASTRRRYSHPAAIESTTTTSDLYTSSRQQRYNHIIQQPPQQPTSYDHLYFNSQQSTPSTSSSSYSGGSMILTANLMEKEEQQRRMSYQSDAALSMELIRRFSSGSTTSTIATSFSSASVSSFSLAACSTTIDSHNDKNNKSSAQTWFNNSSSEAHTTAKLLEKGPETAEGEKGEEGGDNINNTLVGTTIITDDASTQDENKHFISSDNNKNIPTTTAQQTEEEEEKELMDRDPGHACNTTTMMQQQSQQGHLHQQQKDVYPIWADPIKIKENPTRYESVKKFLHQHEISLESSLPLSKPCTFYFSDNNNKSNDYMSAVKSIFSCDSVWQFSARWRIFKEQFEKKPSQLLPNQNLFCFVNGVEPAWEDPVNQQGGRFIVPVEGNKVLDDVFEWLLLALIGAGLYQDGVVGIVVSKRYRGDRIELWFDASFDDTSSDTVAHFKEKLCSLLPKSCHNEINASRYKKHF